MFGRVQRHRKLRFEALEGRTMLDGTVLLSVVKGSLTITGDKLDNTITVETSGAPQTNNYVVSVVGVTTQDQYGYTRDTTLRMGNLTGSKFAVTGVKKDIAIKMLGGSDIVGIGFGVPITFPGKLSIDMGPQYDRVFMQYANIQGALNVNLGSGKGYAQIKGDNVHGTTSVSGGSPMELLLLNSIFDDKLTINGGALEDSFTITGCKVARSLSIDMKNGSNKLDLTSTQVGMQATSKAGDQLYVKGGVDSDYFTFGGVGPGSGVKANLVKINVGAGDDYVYFGDSEVAKDVAVALGGDYDALNFRGNKVHGKATLDGGAGEDIRNASLETSNTVTGKLTIKGLERTWT